MSLWVARAAWPGGRSPDSLRDVCFSLLYGLPAPAVVGIGYDAAGRYLPVFKVRTGDIETVERTQRVEYWLGSAGQVGGTADDHQEPVQPAARSLTANALNTDRFYTQAVRHLERACDGEYQDAMELAARVEETIWQCIYQRRENVWAADDPVAFVAELDEWHLIERAAIPRDETERQLSQARLTALAGFLRGRDLEENAAANAVEMREWRWVRDRFAPVVRAHPWIDEAALQRDLDRWRTHAWSDRD